MHLTHKIALDPTPAQEVYFRQACGTARFVWNWALTEWHRQYDAGQKPNAMTLKKTFNAIKYIQWPWLKDIPRDAHAQPFAYLAKAWHCFFADRQAENPPTRLPSRKRARHGTASMSPTIGAAWRAWTCPVCDTRHDRDSNAARNLAALAALPEAIGKVTPARYEASQ
jgi:transposase